jgi:hypothetical protein
VKRVVGLPGERVAIRHGDVYADGRLQRTSLAELKQVAVVVHDDGYRPQKTEGLPARWQGIDEATNWQAAPDGYECHALKFGGQLDWLTYRHWAGVLSSFPRTRESPVRDNDSYNQGVSRDLQDVPDLMLSAVIETHGKGELALRLHDGEEWFEVRLWPERGEAIFWRQGSELARGRFPPGALRRGASIEFALCDQQILLAITGQSIFQVPYERRAKPPQPLDQPIGIGAAGLSVRVSGLRVLRDIHYLDPLNTGANWSAERRLDLDEFFVLGDNPPISQDSRVWKPRSVTRARLLGTVRRR